jgi:hypothetical protein
MNITPAYVPAATVETFVNMQLLNDMLPVLELVKP